MKIFVRSLFLRTRVAIAEHGKCGRTNFRDGIEGKVRCVIPKLPYKYSYKFLSDGDIKPRTLMIEDWEIGGLYWNCLRENDWNEVEANRLVRKKYFDEFLAQKDLYLLLGTTLQFHLRHAPNPFLIIGVFYPPKTGDVQQMALF
jgi:hypothetical protein